MLIHGFREETGLSENEKACRHESTGFAAVRADREA
jgi:hypothetical protein